MELRTVTEIKNQMYKAQEWASSGNSAVRGMTYEEGVEAALRWALGEEDSEPIENKYESED